MSKFDAALIYLGLKAKPTGPTTPAVNEDDKFVQQLAEKMSAHDGVSLDTTTADERLAAREEDIQFKTAHIGWDHTAEPIVHPLTKKQERELDQKLTP
ncbi:MAG: hypothetical protein WAV41_03180 [Microgenomates group bacterium]